MNKTKVVAIVSGGLDSTSMVLKLEREGYEVIPLNFNYGSKHNNRERQSAREIFGDRLIEIDIDLSFLQKSSLINKDKEIASGGYTEENAKQTVVPFRNAIMASYTVAIAVEKGAKYVAIGNHAGDHYIYPDCRPEFIDAFRKTIEFGTEGEVSLLAPFVNIFKSDIVKQAEPEDADILAKTYSCYRGGEKHCGVCSTCQERKKAFKEAGIQDKTEYME